MVKKYKKAIHGLLHQIFDEETAARVYEANFREEKKSDDRATRKMQKNQERLRYLLEKAASGRKLTKMQQKELKKLL